MATIKDVARVAGVSVATVSRVFNNRGYLSDAVRSKVNDAIKQLDYQPNDLARSLHRQKSNILGLIVPSVSHPFFGEIARSIELQAYENGYKLLLCNSLHNSEKEREYIEMLKRSQVDGIIMGSHSLNTSDYSELSLPVISLDRKLSDGIPYICSDNYQGGELATRHLLERGCKNLVHICGALEINMMSNRRTDAFLDVCKTANVQYKCCQLPDSAVIDFNSDDFISRVLSENPQCDGVFATSDVTAALVLAIAQKQGRRVPQDLQVVGFDGGLISMLTAPKLTTIVQPINNICRYAVEHLLRMASGDDAPSQTILPVSLAQRESTIKLEA